MREDIQSHQALTILHIASGDLWAGAETQLYYLATALNSFPGITLHIVLLNEGVLSRKLVKKGVNVTVLDETKLNFLMIMTTLVKLIYRIDADVIHTHRFKENILGSIASLFYRNSKCIRTIHGGSEHKKSIFNVKKNVLDTIEKLTGKYLTKFNVYVSYELRARLLKSDDVRHVVIENGINFEEVEKNSSLPSSVNDEASIKKVAFIGRLVSVKRLDLFLDIAKLIKDEGNTRIKFYIIGDGPLRKDISSRIISDELGNFVCELGHFDNPLPNLKKMDCLLITSDHEGLPMSLLEAMYLKVLVISHNVGGVSKVIVNNKSGILIDTQHPSAYVEALKRILFDDAFYNSMVDQGYNNVTENYSSTKNAAKYVDIYKKANV